MAIEILAEARAKAPEDGRLTLALAKLLAAGPAMASFWNPLSRMYRQKS